MPQFRITAPDGTIYNVTGPDGATEQDALAQVMAQHPANAAPNAVETQMDNIGAESVPDASRPVGYYDHQALSIPNAVNAAGNVGLGMLNGALGIPGDIESLLRWSSRKGGAVGQQNVLPTTGDLNSGNSALSIGGVPGTQDTATERGIGSFLSPVALARGLPLLARGIAAGGRAVAGPVSSQLVPPDIQAQMLLSRALARDNISPQNAADTLAQFGPKPAAVMDVGGPATARLARAVNTLPGEGSTQVSQFLAERQADQAGRVLSDISQNLATGGDVYGQAKQLMTERAATAKPAYDAAFEGGSIAPLQDQLRAAVQQATAQKGAVQRQITAIEQNNPGALAARGAAGAQTRAQYMDLHQQLQQAEADRQATLNMFKTAQSDAASNAPGAVWSPRIQQFLDQPEVQQGIQRGLKIQRLEAVGNGTPFNPTEYGITGTDANGNAIISDVPNMRLLDAGKRGLDAMIADNTDAVTGKVNDLGRALTIAKNGYVGELDRLNPLYKTARDAYAGPSASLAALNDGSRFLTMAPEQLADRVSNMSDSEQQFFRMGAARALQDRVGSMADSSDAVKRVFGNATIRKQIGAVFGQDAADQFAQSMTPEKIATMTNQFVRGGSNTANKLADVSGTSGSQIVQDAATGLVRGGPAGAVLHPLRNQVAAGISAFFNGMNPAVRASLGDILTRTGPDAISTLNSLGNTAKVASPIGSAAIGGVGALAANPILRALLLQSQFGKFMVPQSGNQQPQ